MTEQESATVLPAKLTAPRADGAVPRLRLFRLLDEACQRPVVWLGAPAGSGKTTLVASYLAARKIKPLWYQVDARDADPAAFFAYLRQAIGKLAPRKRETLPLLTPEYALGLPVFTLNFFEQLFSRLRKPGVLVFDNFQELPPLSPLHELMPQIIAALPGDVRIIFISRTDLPARFAPLRASRRIAQISAEEMLLQASEAVEVGRQLMTNASSDKFEALNKRVNGWIAGLILLLEGANDAVPEPVLNASVFDYFAAETMSRADTETQTFLAQSALLPVMDVQSTEALTGNGHAEVILRDLVRRNYFVSRIPGEVMRYEFHPLFRNYLLDELARRSNAEELRNLRQRAGRILVLQGEYAAAVDLLANAGAMEDLIALVLGNAEKLVSQGQYQTLAQWLGAIPETMYEIQPWIVYWLGISRLPFNPLQARNYFAQAYELFEQADDATGLYLSWTGVADTYPLMWDEFHSLESWLERYESLRKRHPDFPSPRCELMVMNALFGALVFLRPNSPECREVWVALENMLDKIPDIDFKVRLITLLGTYRLWCGDFAATQRYSVMFEQLMKNEMVTPLSRIHSSTLTSNYYWIVGEPEMALDIAAAALQLSEKTGIYFLRALIASQMIYASGIQGDVTNMGRSLESMHMWLTAEHAVRCLDEAHYFYLLAYYQSLCGEDLLAVSSARRALELSKKASAPMPIALCQIELARQLVRVDEYAEADTLLNDAFEFMKSMGNRHQEYSIRLQRAYAFYRLRNVEACEKELGRALTCCVENNYTLCVIWDRGVIALLCAFALERNVQPDFVRRLIRKYSLVPENTTEVTDTWPWPLKIYTLGRFTLLKNADSDIQPAKTQKKTLDLLKALIAFGGRDVSDQKLCEALWPQAEGDLAHQSFKVTLHRLRKLIGADALVIQDGKLSLDARHAWVDAWAFERLLGALENASTEGDIAARVGQAIKLYGGAFLQSDEEVWTLTLRERLRSKFLRIIGQATDCLCSQTHCAEVISCYQKGIEIDPLAESFYQGQMQCHSCLKQPAAGIAVYQRCREALERELGVFPSSKTEELHTQLRQLSA
ncbi:MAG: hypothetical protein KKH12_03305 [Gammaproteobacteria bacterium]|nr:hypothetical protein [Gammaproteobacteria bacterium]MBU1480682.1 hypothetical protein [Gammaproteobacteria bacterium]